MKWNRKLGIAATVSVIGIGVIAQSASGSPATGVTPTMLVTANLDYNVRWNSDGVKFQTKAPTDVGIQKLVFAPGGSTGWHHHPGIAIGVVASGSVTFWDTDCHAMTYGPGLPNGSSFVEGGDKPMNVTSAAGATSYVTFVAPSTDPPRFRIEDDGPTCATSVALGAHH